MFQAPQGAPRPAPPPPVGATVAAKPPGPNYFDIRKSTNKPFVVIGALISLLAGTWGMSRQMVEGETTIPTIIVVVLSFLTMASINLRQMAYTLMPADEVKKKSANNIWVVRRAGFYAIDFLMVLVGSGGLSAIVFVLNRAGTTFSMAANFFWACLMIGLAYIAAVHVEDGLKDMFRFDNLKAKRKADHGFEDLRRKCLYWAGSIAMVVSVIATSYGAYVASAELAIPPEWQVPVILQGTLSFALGLFLQLAQLRLVEKRHRNGSENVVLSVLFIADAGLLFMAIGGLGLMQNFWGMFQLSTLGLSQLIAFAGKVLTAYNCSIEAELAIKEARLIGVDVPADEKPEEKPAAAATPVVNDPNAWMKKITTPDKVPAGWMPLQFGNRPGYTCFVDPNNRANMVFVENTQIQQSRPVAVTPQQLSSVPPPPKTDPASTATQTPLPPPSTTESQAPDSA